MNSFEWSPCLFPITEISLLKIFSIFTMSFYKYKLALSVPSNFYWFYHCLRIKLFRLFKVFSTLLLASAFTAGVKLFIIFRFIFRPVRFFALLAATWISENFRHFGSSLSYCHWHTNFFARLLLSVPKSCFIILWCWEYKSY